MSDRALVICHRCGTSTEVPKPVSRGALCGCGADLRCCFNCRFHDRAAYNECGEPSAERVVEKDRSNFCDYFAPASRATSGVSADSSSMSELERLFSKK